MGRGIFLVVGLLLIMPMVSAGILLGQPESVYNVGDEFDLDITLNPASNTNDFLKLNIACQNDSVEIYRSPFNLNSGEQRDIHVNALLTNSLINGITGTCKLKSIYGNEQAESQNFEISKIIEINYELNTRKFNPGQKVSITGSAAKKSGSQIGGFVEIKIESLGISTSKSLNQENFLANITIPKDAKSGAHDLTIRVFETDSSGTVSNEGTATESVTVNQILKKIIIDVDPQSVSPDNTLIYRVNAYDQAESSMAEDISITIYEPGDFVFQNKIVKSGEEETLEIEKKAVPGYWKIEASTQEFDAKKLFYVEELEAIQTSLVNSTLIVTNIGNVPYEGPIEISIGSNTEVRQVSLGIGESKKYLLYAPDGTYTITIDDGNEEKEFGNVFLTGKAVGIKDFKEGASLSASNPFVWGLLIVLALLAIVYIQVRKKKTPEKKNPIKNNEKSPQSDVLYGLREEASIIAMKIGSEVKDSSYVRIAIENALEIAKSAGGKIYVDGDYKIAIFTPSLTRRKDNDFIAVKVGKRMEEVFKEHNSRFSDKIQFGIVINKGQIISETKGSEFKFTTVGNMISKAKRIAGNLHHSALMTDEVARSIHGAVKREKVEEKNAWEITKVNDRSGHQNFLRKFGDKK